MDRKSTRIRCLRVECWCQYVNVLAQYVNVLGQYILAQYHDVYSQTVVVADPTAN